MSFEALTRVIETRFNSNYTSTPVAYENVPFTPPKGLPWVRLTVINGESVTQGITGSTPLVRDTGLIAITVFVPENSGTQAAKALVDVAKTVYEHTPFSGIVALTASVAPAGNFDGWHQTNITIPFRRNRNV